MRRPELLALLFLAAACGSGSSTPASTASGESSSGGEAADEASGGETGGSDADNARVLYERALLAFRNDDCLDSEAVFRRIRREFPYSRYAALADLRVGDCQMRSKSWSEAIQTYQAFVRYRASHPLVPYARFRIAEAHFRQIPKDWFIMPPSHERDLDAAQDALRYLRRFILDYPEDERVPEALEMARRALHVLAMHELYVARFYADRGAWPGVVFRLETMLSRYAGSALEPEALLLIGRAYERLEAHGDARRSYETLLASHADAPQAATARERLAELPPGPPTPTEQRPPAPEPAPEADSEAESEATSD